MKAILHVDNKWGIGKNNSLMFSLPKDMEFFKNTTINKVVVMGSNTLKSFPNSKPLKNRTNIILSSKIPANEGYIVVRDIPSLLLELKNYSKNDVFVIGGAKVYETLLPYCEEVLVTKVNADGEADTFFHNLDEDNNFEIIKESDPILDNGYEIRFLIYRNKATLTY